MINYIKLFLSAFIICLFFTACSNNNTYNKFENIDNIKWSNKDTLVFTPDIKDISKKYEIYLAVRYNKSYDFSNIWLQIYGLDKQPFDRIEIPLFKTDGTPTGKGLKSNFTVTAGYLKGYTFTKKGKQKISIIQNMRKNPLNGIMDVGLVIKQNK